MPRSAALGHITESLLADERVSPAEVALADRLVNLCGFSAEATALAVLLTVAATMRGSVCADLTAVADDFGSLPGDESWPAADAWAQIVEADIARVVGVSPIVVDRHRVYLRRYWLHEQRLARGLTRLAASLPCLRAPDHSDAFFGSLRPTSGTHVRDETQVAAVSSAVTNRMTVIAGGPGTGKTATIARIYAMLSAATTRHGHQPRIALVAPTGRAAARLKEEMTAYARAITAPEAVTQSMLSVRPSTIHRLLGSRAKNRSRFRHNENNPLPYDAVIVDECSMVSLALMDQLTVALPEDAALILVGDPQQLASVEAGSAFGDIVSAFGAPGASSGAGCVVLKTSHRFGDDISELAAGVLDGDRERVIEALDVPTNGSIAWVRSGAGELGKLGRLAVLEPLTPTLAQMRAAAERGDVAAAIAAAGSFRVLCGHRLGNHGVGEWNRLAFSLGFPDASLDQVDSWFVGRPVLITKNDHNLDVYNGDTGVAIAGSAPGMSAVFDRAPAPMHVSSRRLGHVETCFASTVHKSQGSQFDEVVLILPPHGSRLMSRELLYTAITRTRSKLTIVGDEAALTEAIANRTVRHSGLYDALVDAQP